MSLGSRNGLSRLEPKAQIFFRSGQALLEMLKQSAPGITGSALIYNPDNPATDLFVAGIRAGGIHARRAACRIRGT
jgi:hypothetical protein